MSKSDVAGLLGQLDSNAEVEELHLGPVAANVAVDVEPDAPSDPFTELSMLYTHKKKIWEYVSEILKVCKQLKSSYTSSLGKAFFFYLCGGLLYSFPSSSLKVKCPTFKMVFSPMFVAFCCAIIFISISTWERWGRITNKIIWVENADLSIKVAVRNTRTLREELPLNEAHQMDDISERVRLLERCNRTKWSIVTNFVVVILFGMGLGVVGYLNHCTTVLG